MALRAITFDFWRTLFTDPVPRERYRRRYQVLAEATGQPMRRCKRVFKEISDEFLAHHVTKQATLGPADAVRMAEEKLGFRLSAGDAEKLANDLANVILEYPPVPIPGAIEAVRYAAQNFRVGIISDAGMSPSHLLRQLLRNHGFEDAFQGFAFSNDVGVAKPQRRIFERAANDLRVEPGELFHIGDLEPTDIAGANRFGARSGLFAGDNDRFANDTTAHYVFRTWEEFVDVLPGIDAR